MLTRQQRATWHDAYALVEPQINADAVHVWPFDPAFPVDVRFLILEESRHIRMNRHDYLELLYLDSGQVSLRLQDRELRVDAGSLTLIGTTQYHSHAVRSGGRSRHTGARAVVLFFLPSVLGPGALAGDGAHYLAPFHLLDAGASPVVGADTGVPGRALSRMRRMASRLPARTPLDRLEVKGLLELMLVDLARHYGASTLPSDDHAQKRVAIARLQPLFDHIAAHFHEPIHVAEAAQVMRMSPSQLRRFFRRVTGQGFTAYLMGFRVAKAQQLLRETCKSLAEIALDVGFCDQSYFGLVFRRAMGMTPRQYQRRLAGR